MQNSITHGQISNTANIQPMPQAVPVTPPAAPVSNPNYAGVNIQIFNPMVGSPQGNIYPQQTGLAYDSGTQGGCYPAGYYTGRYPTGTFVPQNPYGVPQNGGTYDMNGVYYPPNPNGHPVPGTTTPNGQNGYYDQNGVFHPTPNGSQTSAETKKNDPSSKTIETGTPNSGAANQQAAGASDKPVTDGADGAADKEASTTGTSATTETSNQGDTEGNNGVTDKNGKTDENNSEKNADAQNAKEADKDNSAKKTETRKIVELSDDYIKTLENYLNSQDTEVRLMGAKEVVNRASEDDSRKDDPALTALVNKMLQDPSSAIRAIALSLVDSRTILGDDYTVNVLKKMQTSKDGFGQDSVQATSALLKMAGKTVEKEFEVKETPKQEKK